MPPTSGRDIGGRRFRIAQPSLVIKSNPSKSSQTIHWRCKSNKISFSFSFCWPFAYKQIMRSTSWFMATELNLNWVARKMMRSFGAARIGCFVVSIINNKEDAPTLLFLILLLPLAHPPVCLGLIASCLIAARRSPNYHYATSATSETSLASWTKVFVISMRWPSNFILLERFRQLRSSEKEPNF